MLFIFVSQLFIAVTEYLIINNVKEKIFVWAWLQSFQSKVICLYHLGPDASQKEHHGGKFFNI